MKRLAWVVFIASLLVAVAATPAVAAPGPPDHPEWWFDTWNVPGLWASGARGEGITIGEIDTGVNASLPELSANVLSGTDFGGFGGNGQTDRDTDDFGHGTAMASLMVAHDGQDNILGMAPDAQVLPIAVPITGTTDDAGDQAEKLLLQAIRWAADHGAKIISMSLGSQRGPTEIGRSCPAAEQGAVDYALSKGAIVVASGGNSGDSGSPIEDPGVCLGVVSVGAVDHTNTVPDWSSKHPYLTVAAPGVDVPSISKIPGEAFFGDGTSQAAALTSAGLAVIWSKYPKLTNRQVVARLLATVDFKHATRDSGSGYGVINIGSAVTTNVPTDAPNPIYDAVAPFLAEDKAIAAPVADPKIRPATTRKDFPGSFSVAAAPNPLTSGPGLGGIVAGGIGLIAVFVLVLGATRRRHLAVAGVPSSLLMSDPPTEPIPVIAPVPEPTLVIPGSPNPSASVPEPTPAVPAGSPAQPTPAVPAGSPAQPTPPMWAGPDGPGPAASTPEPDSSRTTETAPLSQPPAPATTEPQSTIEPQSTTEPQSAASTTGQPSLADAAALAMPPGDSPVAEASPAGESTVPPPTGADSPTNPSPALNESSRPAASAPPPVDSPGKADSPGGESPSQPAVEVDSPTGSASAVGESTRDGEPEPAPVDPPPRAESVVGGAAGASASAPLGEADSPVAKSPTQPAVGVDSPIGSASAVGESTRDGEPEPGSVNSPGEVGESPTKRTAGDDSPT